MALPTHWYDVHAMSLKSSNSPRGGFILSFITVHDISAGDGGPRFYIRNSRRRA